MSQNQSQRYSLTGLRRKGKLPEENPVSYPQEPPIGRLQREQYAKSGPWVSPTHSPAASPTSSRHSGSASKSPRQSDAARISSSSSASSLQPQSVTESSRYSMSSSVTSLSTHSGANANAMTSPSHSRRSTQYDTTIKGRVTSPLAEQTVVIEDRKTPSSHYYRPMSKNPAARRDIEATIKKNQLRKPTSSQFSLPPESIYTSESERSRRR
ncbi:hypothetical protein M422DRAFT_784268 [Sphaerobolus stellatus SS14]|uniref:Uncharacterized protein n=1 Tax=Sphaerobolus stellatus (strain SS14) TaxID=990650 RepID=A0A0C9UWD2_SPHS4|nr:hypothetical protein M422DRAFT_784268 [Sphaerobolus stellatus SS14]